jgi:hypothetical protein
MCGFKSEEVTGGWRKMHKEEAKNLQSSLTNKGKAIAVQAWTGP